MSLVRDMCAVSTRSGSFFVLCSLLCCASPKTREQVADTPVAADKNPDDSPTKKDAGSSIDASRSGSLAEANELVDIETLVPGIVLDMRYAGRVNFVGETLYPKSRCLLRRSVAEALARVQQHFAASSLSLLIWDCYRPFSIQEKMWKAYPKPRYVARPVRENGIPFKGSKHNRGAAVDLSLMRLNGSELLMPTDHDDFSPRAHRDARIGIPKEAINNSLRLEEAMRAEGFRGIASEWWHFDFSGWQEFPLSDEPL